MYQSSKKADSKIKGGRNMKIAESVICGSQNQEILKFYFGTQKSIISKSKYNL
jgi:hypothetical protein